MKRPASVKSKEYKSVKYVRVQTPVGPQRLRGDQTAWRRNLRDRVYATDAAIVKMLTQDKLLMDWKNRQCPRCERGTLSGLLPYLKKPSCLKYCCSCRSCRHYLNPHHLHHFFAECAGPGGSWPPSPGGNASSQAHRRPQLQGPQASRRQPQGYRELGPKACEHEAGLCGEQAEGHDRWCGLMSKGRRG